MSGIAFVVRGRAAQSVNRSIDSVQRRQHMTNETFAIRLAQAALAVTATAASVLLIQLALLAN
jgi:hypothetical protein